MNTTVQTRTSGSQNFVQAHAPRSMGKTQRRSAWCSLSWLRRRRPEPTTYEKCLAVHMYFAASPSAREY